MDESQPPARQAKPLLVASIVFVLACAGAGSLIWRLDRFQQEHQRQLATDILIDHSYALQRAFEISLGATHTVELLLRQGNGRISNFDAVARQLLLHYPNISSISLAPDGVIRDIVPLAGNETALGLELLKFPATKDEAELTKRAGKLTLTGPFKLVKGKLAAIGRLPIYLDDARGQTRFWGFVNVEIGFPEALKIANLTEIVNQGFDYELWGIRSGTGNRFTIAASSSTALRETQDHRIELPNTTWILSVAPVAGWGNPASLWTNIAIGLSLSFLLALIAKLMVELRAHKRGLETLVTQRTAEVHERVAELDQAQSIAKVGSWTFDMATNTMRWSAETFRIFGVRGNTPLDRGAVLQLVHPEDRDAVNRAFEDTFKGESCEVDFRILIGSVTRWLHAQADTEFSRQRLMGTVQDITAIKQAELERLESETQFRSLVEQEIAGIYIIQDGKFAYVNPRFAAIRGYDSNNEVIGRDPIPMIAEKDRGLVAENNRRILSGETPGVYYSFTALRKDGTCVDVGAHTTLASYRGRPAIIGLMQDISDKKRAEEEVQRYIARLETAFMSTVQVATMLSEMRDPYTAGHERRVGEIAAAIGAELGFDIHRQQGLRVAGLLHDIGKITIPAEILSKPGKLSEIEFTLIQGHAQASYDVLTTVEWPWPVAQIALQHHERMDGSGYPRQMKGESILLDARILAVADVVEAMSSHRPYRAGLGIDTALAEIEHGSGRAYDVDVADACLRLFRKHHYQLPA